MPTAINGAFDPGHGSFINLPAVVIILLVGWLMLRGKQVSRRVQDIMVLMKIGIILLFIVVGFSILKVRTIHLYSATCSWGVWRSRYFCRHRIGFLLIFRV